MPNTDDTSLPYEQTLAAMLNDIRKSAANHTDHARRAREDKTTEGCRRERYEEKIESGQIVVSDLPHSEDSLVETLQ
jgi:hypothetical protein